MPIAFLFVLCDRSECQQITVIESRKVPYKRCIKCNRTYYCSKRCARLDHEKHREFCGKSGPCKYKSYVQFVEKLNEKPGNDHTFKVLADPGLSLDRIRIMYEADLEKYLVQTQGCCAVLFDVKKEIELRNIPSAIIYQVRESFIVYKL